MAKQSDDQVSTTGLAETLAIAGGLVATPGPVDPLEGVSYLVAVGIVGWSLYTKSKTGSGLPNGLLGAVEGLSYLSLVGILVVFGLQFYQQGFIPGPVPVPVDQCFG
ncbi:uncharacterized protein LOC143585782 [Bidens hawaiensis]|uniref:uncharacterized protein LOC143585782 n=1 Tax=Bidens hawaiensis TaxID=980011 RepID=UPI0040495C92